MEDQPTACPRCGSTDVEVRTKVDLAFGEEVPYRECHNCGNHFDHGLPEAEQGGEDDSG